jgi:hypothetical protein
VAPYKRFYLVLELKSAQLVWPPSFTNKCKGRQENICKGQTLRYIGSEFVMKKVAMSYNFDTSLKIYFKCNLLEVVGVTASFITKCIANKKPSVYP